MTNSPYDTTKIIDIAAKVICSKPLNKHITNKSSNMTTNPQTNLTNQLLE
jgi:hypothetical protein